MLLPGFGAFKICYGQRATFIRSIEKKRFHEKAIGNMSESTTTTISEEEEKLLIQRQYRQLLKSVKNTDEDDRKQLRLAFEIAVRAHEGQRRKSGEPYILHPIEVARICAEEIGLGATAVIAALLHDVVEDTDVTLTEIEEQFGQKVRHIVDGLTKLDSSTSGDSPQAENFKKVLSTLIKDVRVVLIKMADRLHNMRTLGSMPRHKQLKIASETSYIYAPLAHRLGLYAVKTEFQDLCMKITDREGYNMVAKKLRETKASREEYIQKFIEPIHHELAKLPEGQRFEYRITGRPKSIYSIYNKIQTKQVPFEEIYDLFAIRVIVNVPVPIEKPVCWQVYSTVTDIYEPIAERLKDWITRPKANGYESLHTTVVGPDGRFVEVQIRSERMDEIAERGFAAHWKYKGVSRHPNVYENWLDNVRGILDNNETNAIEFISDFKTNLFQDEVFVYTPKGDMIVLPKGATALDFAFHIHSDVGYHCSAVRVNSALKPLGQKLRNGDRVSVITSKNQKPNEGWLKMVVTGKARSKIRSSMKEERRKQGELGREALERKLKKLRAEFDPAIETLVKYHDYKSHTDLYYDIAMEAVSTEKLVRPFLVEHGQLIEKPEEKPEVVVQERKQPVKGSRMRPDKPRLMVGGEPADNYQIFFAKCCNPVQGDDVFAYLTSNAGLKIHRASCPNAEHLMANYGYRVMKAEWTRSAAGTTFVTDLHLTGIDDGVGVIERLSHELSSEVGVNIRSMKIAADEEDGSFTAVISLMVKNSDQLNIIIRKLQQLNIVSTVDRVASKE